MRSAAKQIDVLAKICESTGVCGTQLLLYMFPKTFNTIQIGGVWRQKDKIDSKCLWPLFLNEFASLVLRVVKEQIYGETGHTCKQVCQAAQQDSRRGDIGIICYGCHFLDHKIERTKDILATQSLSRPVNGNKKPRHKTRPVCIVPKTKWDASP